MRVLFFSLIILFFLPLTARADDALVPIPKNMQQRWILKSCERGEVAYRFSSYFQVSSTAYGSKLKRLGGLRDEGSDRYSLVKPSETMAFAVGPSGDLLQYYDRSQTSFTPQSLEDKSAGIPYITFKNCSADGSWLVQENQMFVDLLPGLDRIHEACPTRQDIFTQPTCQKAVFTLFDYSGDEMIDEAEMTRAWGVISANSFRACGVSAPKQDVLAADATAYKSWFFSNLDGNKDQKISFPEVRGQWDRLQSDSLMSGLTNMLIAAEKPIGILPEDMKMTCVNCCIATSKVP